MDSISFFLGGVKHNRHDDVDWMLDVLCVVEHPFSDEMRDWKPFDVGIDRDSGEKVFFNPDNDNSFTIITGTEKLAPIIGYKTKYKLKAGDLPNVDEDMVTLGGNIIVNLYCSIQPFKDKIKFINKKVKPADFDDRVADMLKGDIITVEEYLYYCECVVFLSNFWGVSVPTGSEKTMTVSPVVIAAKEQELKKHAGELNNNVVMTGIENRLVKLDAEVFKGDVAEDFYMSGKSRSVSRKKSKIIVGLDDGLGGSQPSLITKSLSDGMDIDSIPAGADSTTAASYSRGFLTAQGGELVNLLYRVFMSAKISSDDCGTVKGISRQITVGNKKRFIGRYYLDKIGKTQPITPDNIDSLIGKTINVRSPGRCKEKPPNYCAHCTNKFFSGSRESVHIETSLPGSIIMNDRMKAMHGRDFKTAFFEPTTDLT